MILTKGIKVYNRLLEKVVECVNNGWKTNYKVEDVVGMEIKQHVYLCPFQQGGLHEGSISDCSGNEAELGRLR